jgi:hypothetical protein
LDTLMASLDTLGAGTRAQGSPQAPAPVAGPEALAAALDDLIPALKTRKPKPCRQSMEQLLALTWPEGLKSDIARLESLTERYRYSEALDLASAIRINPSFPDKTNP